MDPEQVRKNTLDLKYQHYLSMRNIFWGAGITGIAAYANWIDKLPLGLSEKILAFSLLISIMGERGFYYWDEAQQTMNEIWELAEED